MSWEVPQARPQKREPLPHPQNVMHNPTIRKQIKNSGERFAITALLTGRLGRRRSWALTIQLLLVARSRCSASPSRAATRPTAVAAVVVAFLSASQDIVIDAYRIELLRPEEQGAGAAATQWGYRFGMLAAGAGALYAASFGGWQLRVSADGRADGGRHGDGLRSPRSPSGSRRRRCRLVTPLERTRAWLERAVVAPFRRSRGRNGTLPFLAILSFIVLYKFGDALAGSMANPLYVALHFTKVEVATISKVYGVVATWPGSPLGASSSLRFGVFRALLVCGALQACSNLMYALQVWVGHNVADAGADDRRREPDRRHGLGRLRRLSLDLCSRDFTATQYALLSSLATVGLNVWRPRAARSPTSLGWSPFFVLQHAALPAGASPPRLDHAVAEPAAVQP